MYMYPYFFIHRLIDTTYVIHPWLAEIPAPVGSQEVADHTHEWFLLIGQRLPLLSALASAGWVPTYNNKGCYPISSNHLWVWSTTSWDPTGAGISAIPGWISTLGGIPKFGTICLTSTCFDWPVSGYLLCFWNIESDVLPLSGTSCTPYNTPGWQHAWDKAGGLRVPRSVGFAWWLICGGLWHRCSRRIPDLRVALLNLPSTACVSYKVPCNFS